MILGPICELDQSLSQWQSGSNIREFSQLGMVRISFHVSFIAGFQIFYLRGVDIENEALLRAQFIQGMGCVEFAW